MHPLIALSRNRVRLLRNTLRQGRRGWLRLLGELAGFAILASLAFWGALRFFRFLEQLAAGAPPSVLPQLQLAILSSVVLTVVLFLVMSGMRISYERLFEAGDTAFLLTAPVAAYVAFLDKAIDIYLSGLAVAAPLGLSVLWAFGITTKAPLAFYLTSLLALIFGVVIFQSLIALLLMLIMKFVRGGALRQLFMAVAGIGAMAIVISSQLLPSAVKHGDAQDLWAVLLSLEAWGLERIWFSPHVWLIRAALSPLPQFGFPVAASFLPLIIGAVGCASVAVVLAGRIYLQGWAAGQETGTERRRARSAWRPRRWLGGPIAALVRKDLIVLKREPLFWYNLAVCSVVSGFFAYNVSSGQGTGANADGIGQGMLIVMPVMLAGILSARLGGMGISREGAGWWFLQVSPLRPQLIYTAKLLGVFLPSWLFATAFVTLFHFVPDLPTYPLALALPLATALVAGVASLVLLLDVLTPDFTFRVDLGKRSQRSNGKALVTILASMLFNALAAVTLASPVALRHVSHLAAWDGPAIEAMAIAAAFVEALGALLLGCYLGCKRLARLFVEG